MSEADRQVFEQLPPEAKAWIAKRESETRADYTKKTQAVAELRKNTEAAQSQVLERLQRYDAILSQFTTPKLEPPNPALKQTDPLAYEDQLAHYVHNKHLQEQAATEQRRVRAEAEAHQKHQHQQYWAEQSQRLSELAPELSGSSDQARQKRAGVFAYGAKVGFSKEQLDQAGALDMVTLWKAQQFDAAMQAKANAKPVQPPAPRVMTPGPARAGGRANGFATVVKNLAENPSRAALAAAYKAELASER